MKTHAKFYENSFVSIHVITAKKIISLLDKGRVSARTTGQRAEFNNMINHLVGKLDWADAPPDEEAEK